MIRKVALFCAVLCLHFTFSAFALDTVLQPDYLTPTEAEGRFAWMEKCMPGILVAAWDGMFDPTEPKSDTTKIDELEAIWVNGSNYQYLSFADSDHQNPQNWYAGVSANENCKTIPLDYSVIGLYTALDVQSVCALHSESNDYEYIQNVKIGDFENQSDGYLYSDNRWRWISLRRDVDYDIELTAGYTGDEYEENWIIWIDLDDDGLFDHNNEYFFTGSGAGTVTGTLNIPSATTPGPKTARIIMSFVSHALPCETHQRIQFGEIADYTIYVE